MTGREPVTAAALAADGWSPFEAEPGFMCTVGPLWRRPRPGGTDLGLLVGAGHLNRAGALHGGMLMTFADQALGIAANGAAGSPDMVTVTLAVNFARAVRAGDFLRAHPAVDRTTRSLVFMSGTFRLGEATAATASGIWKVL